MAKTGLIPIPLRTVAELCRGHCFFRRILLAQLIPVGSLLGKFHLPHRFPGVETRASNENRHALAHGTQGGLHELFLLFPQKRVAFAEAAHGGDGIDAVALERSYLLAREKGSSPLDLMM